MPDDQTNPFTIAGMMGMMTPNPYTDPSLQGQPLKLQGYRGTPTDAMGRPIQSFLDTQKAHDAWNAANPAPAQGTTLNSLGVGGGGGASDWSALAPKMSDDPQAQANFAYDLGLGGKIDPTTHMVGMGGGGSGDDGSGTAAAPPQNPVDMRQAYLDALSNPGHVTTPGATVPQAAPLGSPSVMNAFLAAHPGGGTAAPAGGGYGNKGFFDTLNQLRSA